LNEEGMLIDFTIIKDIVGTLDHTYLNAKFNFNPTAENIAQWITEQLEENLSISWKGIQDRPYVTKVEIQESRGNTACYIPNIH